MIRQWRVGTLSMGILLIVVGLVCLISNFTGDYMLIKAVLNFWPMVLILLGIEVLTYSFFLKIDSPRIRYDGFSIVIILFILFFSCCAYLFQSLLSAGKIEWLMRL